MKIGVQSYNYLEDYLDAVRAKGRYAFTVDELKEKFDISDKAIHQNLYRLKAKKRIVQVRQRFYTILPAEYARQGMLPTNLFIDDMMNMLNKKYYVGLISAGIFSLNIQGMQGAMVQMMSHGINVIDLLDSRFSYF